MQDKHLYEYAILRVVPRAEREEFMNVGVVLYCRSRKFLDAVYTLDEDRLKALCADMDIEEIAAYLRSFGGICSGGRNAGPIGALAVAERFRWLTATRSTIIRTSQVHPGLCDDPAATLQRLFEQLVL